MNYPIFIYAEPGTDLEMLIDRYWDDWQNASEYSIFHALQYGQGKETYVIYTNKSFLRLI